MAELIIDDSNFTQFINPIVNGEKKFCATRPRTEPHGGMYCAPRSTMKKIPRSEFDDRIQYLIDTKSRTSDIIKRSGMKPLDQAWTNFCWMYGPVNALRIIREINNQPYVDLSPASAACQINGFVNEGGWGTDAIKWLAKNGVVPVELWPNNAIDRKYLTPEAKAAAKNFIVEEWDDLTPNDFDLLATYCLMGIPVAIGLDWWGHEVCACDLVRIEAGGYGIRIYNSWGMWEQEGFAILRESKAIASDQVAPRVVTQSPLFSTAT